MRTRGAERLRLRRGGRRPHAERQAGLEVEPLPVGVSIERGVRGSASGGRRRRPRRRSTRHLGGPPGATASSAMPMTSWRARHRTRRRRSRRHRRRARGQGRERGPPERRREDGGRKRSCGNRPGGSAAHWRPWCLLLVGAPSAGEAGCGQTKSPLHTGSGPGAVAHAVYPVAPMERTGVKENDRQGGALHERIIMHGDVFRQAGSRRPRRAAWPAIQFACTAGRRAFQMPSCASLLGR